MTTASEHLERGRAAFDGRAWTDAYTHLSAADSSRELEQADLEKLALAARLIGNDEAADAVMVRVHQGCLDRDDVEGAARAAFWLGMSYMSRGEFAPGGGWLARAARVLEEAGADCVERGLLLIPAGLQKLAAGDPTGAEAEFRRASEVGERFADPNLITFARLGLGQSLLRQGQTQEAVSLLDEAMVSATTDRVSPVVTGIVYCGVIDACRKIFDLRRAQEWTELLTQWCESQPDLVPFRGQCLVHRSEILQLHGAWSEALAEAQRAQERLEHPFGRAAIGAAWYQLGELHRLRGDLEAAEKTYRQAHLEGHAPQPGLALLRLAQGDVAAAAASLRSAVAEGVGEAVRQQTLPAQVEIFVAAGDLAAARAAADELVAMAAASDATYLQGLAEQARGAVLLAEGDARAAVDALRAALNRWFELDAPYEASRTRVLIGMACRGLGDEGGAEMELDSARMVFARLGAAVDLARVDALIGVSTASPAQGLTGREVEVLALVASGKTNRDIASELVISEKTVARHVSNIFIKLGVSSRSAATAYALKHELV